MKFTDSFKQEVKRMHDLIASIYAKFVHFIRDGVSPFMRKAANTTTFFIVVFLYAWYMNGMNHTTFDLSMLIYFYGVIAGLRVTGKTVDSVFNSPRNEPPKRG